VKAYVSSDCPGDFDVAIDITMSVFMSRPPGSSLAGAMVGYTDLFGNRPELLTSSGGDAFSDTFLGQVTFAPGEGEKWVATYVPTLRFSARWDYVWSAAFGMITVVVP
jgi:hypothetical protein